MEAFWLLTALVWIPVLLYQISRRGFVILLIWLFIAPIATNLVRGSSNPFFASKSSRLWGDSDGGVNNERPGRGFGPSYAYVKSSLAPRDFLEPTRNLIVGFLVLFILGGLIRKRTTVVLDRTEIWMVVFATILIGSLLTQTRVLFFGIRIVGDGFIVPFLGYFIARRLIYNDERFRQLTRILGYMGLYVGLVCLVERLVAEYLIYRVQGPFQSQGTLHTAMTAVFYAVLLKEKQSLPQGIQTLLLVSIPCITLLTLNRGTWVGFAFGAMAWLFLARHLTIFSKRVGVIGSLLVFGIITAITVFVSLPEDVLESRIGNESTIEWRLLRWQVALQVAMENPVLGIGLNNLRDALGSAGLNYAAAHNAFLSLLAELGTVGLLAYLAIIMSITRMGWSLYRNGACMQDRWRGIAVIATMVSYQIPGTFNNEFYSSDLGAIYVFIFVGAIAGVYNSGRSIAREGAFFRERAEALSVPASGITKLGF